MAIGVIMSKMVIYIIVSQRRQSCISRYLNSAAFRNNAKGGKTGICQNKGGGVKPPSMCVDTWPTMGGIGDVSMENYIFRLFKITSEVLVHFQTIFYHKRRVEQV